MNTVRAATELETRGRRVCIAIGFFDGVHLGHQQIIRTTIADAAAHDAMSVVVTFDRHPKAVILPDRVPPLIYSLPQKLRAIAELGAEAVLLLEFSPALSRLSGEEFIRDLARDLGRLQSVCVGSDFHFGRARSGNVELLRRLGQPLQFNVHGLAAVSLEDQPVRSTRIRDAIAVGQLEAASQMLGRAYGLAGPVVQGDQLGRQLGFPTANIDTSGLAVPPHGVYAVRARVAGRTHRALLNIGLRPTLARPEPRLRVEAHLLDFQGDLYGQELEVVFVEKLRDEIRFGSLDELKHQIARDRAAALRCFA
jgi:riboflavin kinase / FMN adenylyltransferase